MAKTEARREAPYPPDQQPQNSSLPKRLLWFVVLWGGSVLALTVVSQLIRWAIMP